jgi:hypothetical protein
MGNRDKGGREKKKPKRKDIKPVNRPGETGAGISPAQPQQTDVGTS